MNQKQQDIHKQLQALRDSYVAELPARVADIQQDWEALPAAAIHSTALYELYRKLHSMAGSAGSFGVPALGQAAQRIEQYLKSKLEMDPDWSSTERTEIAAGIAELRQLIETHAKSAVQPQSLTIESKSDEAEHPTRLVYLMEEDASRSARLQGKLAHFGYQVETFYDRGELLTALQQEPPMALIMDFHSLEVQAACSNWLVDYQRDQENELPVLFIAKDVDFELRMQAVRAGGYAYLDQPVDIAALVDCLDNVNQELQPEPYRVIVVDDDGKLAQHIVLILEQAGVAAWVVTDPTELLDKVSEFQPDLILMDLYMPDCSGKELAQLIRQDVARVSMPIVFLSAETDPEKQFSALMTGGDDFITKPVQDIELIAVVKSRAQRARVLENAMSRDSLTGLLKHTKIKEALELELSRNRRRGLPLSYAMIDIDFFKRVNDTYGHPMGDRVIKSLSHLLKQRLRQTDLIGRYGGEEFAVVLADTDAAGAIAVIEKVRVAFSEIEFDADQTSFCATLSVGLVTCIQCGDANEVAEQADRALYEAKHNGRNRIVSVTLSGQT